MSDFTEPPPRTDGEARPPIDVRLDRDGTSGYTAIVSLCGEHDLASAVDIQETLGSIWGNVLVDLTACEFIDSTVIGVLVRDYQLRHREGQRLELLVPAENTTISRTLEITGMRDALTIHRRADSATSAAS
jgi:anti-anti-sigma factor